MADQGIGLRAADEGCLVLADISGYTAYLNATELEHAQDVLADLIAVIVSNLEPVLRVVEVEGDAAFAYALVSEIEAAMLLDTIDRTYFAFRARTRDVAQASTCECGACRLVPSLGLKFVVHHGRFVLQDVGGRAKPTGPDVVLVHRLLKNDVSQRLGLGDYALLTEACAQVLAIDAPALGLVEHEQRYDDVGQVRGFVEDLGRRWESEQQRRRFYVVPAQAQFELKRVLPASPETLWEYNTAPRKRMEWTGGVTGIEESSPGGRRGVGSTAHCFHGKDLLVEEVLDWRPYRYFTRRSVFRMVGPWAFTFEFVPVSETETEMLIRGEKLRGKGALVWRLFLGRVLMRAMESHLTALAELLTDPSRSTAADARSAELRA